MTFKLPAVIGHRGACEYAPENTAPSIYAAIDIGVKAIEFDVKLSRDGVPILFHDDDLSRTTNGTGLVKDMDWADLRELDAGSWKGEGFITTPILSFEDALDIIIEHEMIPNIEIKPCPGRAKDTAEATLDMISQYWPDEWLDRLVISSFDMSCLEIAADMAPDYHRGLLLPSRFPNEDELDALVNHIAPSTIHFSGNAIDDQPAEPDHMAARIHMLRKYQKPLYCYTINQPQDALWLRSQGVSGVFSDCPDIIMEEWDDEDDATAAYHNNVTPFR